MACHGNCTKLPADPWSMVPVISDWSSLLPYHFQITSSTSQVFEWDLNGEGCGCFSYNGAVLPERVPVLNLLTVQRGYSLITGSWQMDCGRWQRAVSQQHTFENVLLRWMIRFLCAVAFLFFSLSLHNLPNKIGALSQPNCVRRRKNHHVLKFRKE